MQSSSGGSPPPGSADPIAHMLDQKLRDLATAMQDCEHAIRSSDAMSTVPIWNMPLFLQAAQYPETFRHYLELEAKGSTRIDAAISERSRRRFQYRKLVAALIDASSAKKKPLMLPSSELAIAPTDASSERKKLLERPSFRPASVSKAVPILSPPSMEKNTVTATEPVNKKKFSGFGTLIDRMQGQASVDSNKIGKSSAQSEELNGMLTKKMRQGIVITENLFAETKERGGADPSSRVMKRKQDQNWLGSFEKVATHPTATRDVGSMLRRIDSLQRLRNQDLMSVEEITSEPLLIDEDTDDDGSATIQRTVSAFNRATEQLPSSFHDMGERGFVTYQRDIPEQQSFRNGPDMEILTMNGHEMTGNGLHDISSADAEVQIFDPKPRKILRPKAAASGRLQKQAALASRVRDRQNQEWVSAEQLNDVMQQYIRSESTKLARAGVNWKEFARLLVRPDRFTGSYCVQCNIISHAKHECGLGNEDEACSRCIQSGRACSKLIEIDGVTYLGWLPLPVEDRGAAKWQEEPYWIPHEEVVIAPPLKKRG